MNRGQRYGRSETPGSQRYLQDLVNDNSSYLNSLVLKNSPSLFEYAQEAPKWVSPLVKDNYEEYPDDIFLWQIEQAPFYKKLHDFWPRRGPQWDALAIVEGKNGVKGAILVEAKAHILEVGSQRYACRASSYNREQIEESLTIVKQALGAKLEADWMGDYYQYANRLAHLYFLHVMCKVPTWMVFIYFLSSNRDFPLPTRKDWDKSLARVQKTLGLPQDHLLTQRIVNVFPKVNK